MTTKADQVTMGDAQKDDFIIDSAGSVVHVWFSSAWGEDYYKKQFYVIGEIIGVDKSENFKGWYVKTAPCVIIARGEPGEKKMKIQVKNEREVKFVVGNLVADVDSPDQVDPNTDPKLLIKAGDDYYLPLGLVLKKVNVEW